MKVKKSPKNFLKSFLCFFISILTILSHILLSTTSVYAVVNLPSGRDDEFGENNIVFYDPGNKQDECEQTSTPTVGWDGTCATLSDQQKAWVDKWHDKVVSLGSKYNIPWEGPLAQSILESTSGTSNFAKTRHNFFGIGAFDDNPKKAYAWNNDEEGWEGYFKFISGIRPGDIQNHGPTTVYKNNGATSPPASTDPYLFITILKKSGYATDANYIQKNSAIICGIQKYAKEKGWSINASPAETSEEEGGETGGEENENTGENNNTDNCSSKNTKSGEIVSGGFKTVEEAAEFMRVYINEARKKEKINPKSVAGTPVQAPSSGYPADGTLNNCSAFTQWFVRHYTSLKNAPLVDGNIAAERYASMGLGDGQVHAGTPQVYAVMSKGSSSAGKHTGIVLGIDKERGKIIIGEASWHNGFVEGKWPYAHEYNLSAYQSSSIRYAYTGLSGSIDSGL